MSLEMLDTMGPDERTVMIGSLLKDLRGRDGWGLFASWLEEQAEQVKENLAEETYMSGELARGELRMLRKIEQFFSIRDLEAEQALRSMREGRED